MGMDVDGKNPTSERGKYFRNNVWWWHPLWDYCEVVQPEMGVRYGHSNDGDGLDARGAIALAEALTVEIESGRTSTYEASYMDKAGRDEQGVRYPFSVENVTEFRDFLRDCGGFEIW